MELSNFIITHIIMGAFWSVVIFLVWLWGHRHCRALKARNVDLEQQLADAEMRTSGFNQAIDVVMNGKLAAAEQRAEEAEARLERDKVLADWRRIEQAQHTEELQEKVETLEAAITLIDAARMAFVEANGPSYDMTDPIQAAWARTEQVLTDLQMAREAPDPDQQVIGFEADIEKVPEGEENLPQSTQRPQRDPPEVTQ